MRPGRPARRRTAARFALALAGVIAGGTAVRAQDVPQVISPLRVESDHNGVNLISGKTVIGTPVLSVPGAPNLRFDRIQNAAPYVDGRVTGGGPNQLNTRTYSVHTGTGTSESFQCVDYDCTSVTGSGSTFLWNINKYRQAGSAAVWTYNLQHVVTPGPNQQMRYYASQVTYPNGEVITYAYDTHTPAGDPYSRVFYRPNRITSSLGFFISLTYQSGDFDSAGWAQVAEATSYASAADTVPLRTLTYNAGGTTITEVGNAENPSRVYSCAGCINQLGVNLEVGAGSNQLPGEASPATQVAAVPNLPEQSGGAPVGSVTRDGVTWTYAYGNLRYEAASQSWLYDDLTVTGPNGFHNVYDIAAVATSTTTHRLVLTSVTDSIERHTAVGFDGAFRPVHITYPEGNEVDVAYDDYGNIHWRRTRATPGSGLPDIVETASYPTDTCFSAGTPILCYRPTWSRDALGRQTDYVYNANGQLTEQTDPADANGVRRRTIIEYAASVGGISRRSVVRVCGVGTTCGVTGQEIRTEYDYWGNTFLPSAERWIDAAAGVTLTTTYSYDPEGRLTSTDGPLAGEDDRTYNRYDFFGRKTWEIGARSSAGLRIATRHIFRDSDDKPVISETGTIPDASSMTLTVFRRTDLSYDSRRNAVRQAVSGSGTTFSVVDQSFDDQGRRTCQAQRMNPALFPVNGAGGSLPADACVPSTEGGQGPDRISRTIYDAAGQRLQVREGVGTAIEAAEATRAYNLNGQITTVIDGNGNRAELRYDGHGRQDRWTFPSATRPSGYDDTSQATALATAGSVNTADYEEYSYDDAGNRTSLRKRDGRNIAYVYDALNRVTAKTYPQGGARPVHYGYDLRGLQTYARFDSPTGDGVISQYDGFGRRIVEWQVMNGVTRYLASQYDAASNRVRITHPDGTEFTAGYDGLGRPYSLATGWGAVIGWMPRFDHGAVGSIGRGNGAATGFSYDQLQRPALLGHYFAAPGATNALWSFGYNPAGQLGVVSRDNDTFAWTGHYAVDRAYTANGLNQYSAAGGAAFAYDANGNLTSDGARTYGYDIENRLISASPGTTLSYDPLGRLFQVAGSSGTTTFLYNGDALVAEYDDAGAMLRRHIHWTGADVPAVTFEGAGLTQPLYQHADHQGSIVALSDASGAAFAINRYDEYGIPAPTNVGRFQYTGQTWLPELGMYHYRARIYSPTLGRFMQTDPIGYNDQINLYAYVGNDPMNHVDPTGMAGQVSPDMGRQCDTGSRVEGNNSGCMVADGFPIAGAGQRTKLAQARPGIGHNSGQAWRAPRRPGTPRIGPGGIRAHEGRGHCCRLHIGKSDAFLRGRIEGGLTRASTFSDEMMANAALTAAVEQNGSSIDAWLTSEFPSSKRIDFVSPIPVGRVMDSRFRVQEGYRAVFILSPNPGPGGGDFNVITGWVEPQ